MKHIGYSIYGKLVVIQEAVATCNKEATWIARNMIPAVFRQEAVLAGTISGQKCRSNKSDVEVKPLHSVAIQAIISE